MPPRKFLGQSLSQRLTNQYLQHEAIEAQKAMVGSPNHTTIYIPVGPMGVPLVGTLDAAGRKDAAAPAPAPTIPASPPAPSKPAPRSNP